MMVRRNDGEEKSGQGPTRFRDILGVAILILGVAILRQSFTTDTDLARNLLDEVKGLKECCYTQRIKAIGGTPVVLFSRHPLSSETIYEWRKLDKAVSMALDAGDR